MRIATVLLIFVACLTLAACATKPTDIAAKACAAEAANRLGGKTFEIDTKAFARNAAAESGDTYLLKAPVTFDKGLNTEYKQICQCRARVDASGAATVLFMQFDWDNEGLKQSQQ